MRNMKISMKFTLSFAVVIVLAIIVGIVGYTGMNYLNQSEVRMYESNVLAIEAMGNLREMFANERNTMRSIILSQNDPAQVKSLMETYLSYEAIATENFAAYEKTITDDAQETAYYAAKTAWYGDYATLKNDCLALINAGEFDKAYETYSARGADVIAPITSGFAESAMLNMQWADEAKQEGGHLFTRLAIIQGIVLLVAIAIAACLGLYIAHLIARPVNIIADVLNQIGTTGNLKMEGAAAESYYSKQKDEIGVCARAVNELVAHLEDVERILGRVADGDLTVGVKILSDRDSIGLSVAKMIDNLSHMFSEINAATVQVNVGSKQIAEGAQSLAQGSTEQASAVQQLSASITEIANKTKENADMALHAANLAGDIKQNAETGNVQMDQMMMAVKEINEASQSISKVIGVIDNIAFQTNILALNAAVEAARAGQHGKGFAVVAEEVRSLASKSAEAAKETGSLIANSIEKAEMGARIANETATSLGDIVSGINESSKIVGDIAKSSNEQAAAITEINNGIDQVAQVVQQNSATAEQSAAASQQMSGQASSLEVLISQFKIKDGQPALKSSSEPAGIAEISSYTNSPDLGMGKY